MIFEQHVGNSMVDCNAFILFNIIVVNKYTNFIIKQMNTSEWPDIHIWFPVFIFSTRAPASVGSISHMLDVSYLQVFPETFILNRVKICVTQMISFFFSSHLPVLQYDSVKKACVLQHNTQFPPKSYYNGNWNVPHKDHTNFYIYQCRENASNIFPDKRRMCITPKHAEITENMPKCNKTRIKRKKN